MVKGGGAHSAGREVGEDGLVCAGMWGGGDVCERMDDCVWLLTELPC